MILLTFFLPSFPIAHTVICRPFGLCAEFLAERVYNEYLIPVVVSTAFLCTLLAHVILEWCHSKYIYMHEQSMNDISLNMKAGLVLSKVTHSAGCVYQLGLISYAGVTSQVAEPYPYDR